MYGANVIIFEGIFTFYNVDVLKVSDNVFNKRCQEYVKSWNRK